MRSSKTVRGAISTNRQIPKTFWVNPSSGDRTGSEDEATDVGRGRGDSRMETAAEDVVPEVPRTMTCRWVDFSAV